MCQKPRTLPTSARFGPTGYEKVPLALLYPHLFLWRKGGVERLHLVLPCCSRLKRRALDPLVPASSFPYP